MIRDLNTEEKIEFSQKAIDEPMSLFWFWLFNVENLFDDISFYLDNDPTNMSWRAKIAGLFCGIVVIPALLVTYCTAQFLRLIGLVDFNRITQLIIFLLFLIPAYFVHIPFSIYTYYVLKKNALIYLITSD